MAVASRLPRRLYVLLRHGGVQLRPWKEELFALAERPQCRDAEILKLLRRACQPWTPINHYLCGGLQARKRIVELYWFLKKIALYQPYVLPSELVPMVLDSLLVLLCSQ